MPRRMNTSTNLDSSAAMIKSQARAMCMPPPAAVPLSPQITGFSQSRMDVTMRCHPRWMVRATSPTMRSGAPSGLGGGSLRPLRRSAPVQKCRSPAPVRTTTRTLGSADASSNTTGISSRMYWVRALPASARLMVRRRMPPSSVRSRSSLTGHPSRQARWLSSSMTWFASQARSLAHHQCVEGDGALVFDHEGVDVELGHLARQVEGQALDLEDDVDQGLEVGLGSAPGAGEEREALDLAHHALGLGP